MGTAMQTKGRAGAPGERSRDQQDSGLRLPRPRDQQDSGPRVPGSRDQRDSGPRAPGRRHNANFWSIKLSCSHFYKGSRSV